MNIYRGAGCGKGRSGGDSSKGLIPTRVGSYRMSHGQKADRLNAKIDSHNSAAERAMKRGNDSAMYAHIAKAQSLHPKARAAEEAYRAKVGEPAYIAQSRRLAAFVRSGARP